MTTSPPLSVVIPTYNGARFIREALQSVFAQTLLPSEIIVVDDCSTDGTTELVQSLASQSPIPMRVIRLVENSGGPARPLNVGIEATTSPFIAGMDQDDVLRPNKLERQFPVLRDNEDLSFVFSLSDFLDRTAVRLQNRVLVDEIAKWATDEGGWYRIEGWRGIELLLMGGNFVGGFPGFIFRRRDWNRKGGIHERFRISTDQEFLFWLSTQGNLGFVPEVHYLRRRHANNLSNNKMERMSDVLRINACYLPKVARLLKEQGVSTESLRARLIGTGFWAREVGSYLDAARNHYAALRVCGWHWASVCAIAKLVPHFVFRQGFRRRNPTAALASAMKLDRSAVPRKPD